MLTPLGICIFLQVQIFVVNRKSLQIGGFSYMNLTALKEKSFKLRGPITLFNKVLCRHEIFLADTKSVGYNCQDNIVALCDGNYMYVLPYTPEVMSVIMTCQFKKTKLKVPFNVVTEPANPELKAKWEAIKTKVA